MNKPFVLSVKVLLCSPDGKYLILRRSAASKNNAGKWDFPGGKVDAGERFDEALTREVEEETGLKINLLRLAGSAQSQARDRIIVYLFMEAESAGSSVCLSSEHTEYRWVSTQELKCADVCCQFKDFVDKF